MGFHRHLPMEPSSSNTKIWILLNLIFSATQTIFFLNNVSVVCFITIVPDFQLSHIFMIESTPWCPSSACLTVLLGFRGSKFLTVSAGLLLFKTCLPVSDRISSLKRCRFVFLPRKLLLLYNAPQGLRKVLLLLHSSVLVTDVSQ